MKRKQKFKPGDRVEIESLDHTCDNAEGWTNPKGTLKSNPLTIRVRGFYMGQDKHSYKVAFAECNGSYSTIWTMVKNKSVKITREK